MAPLRILLVEDNPGDVRLVQEMLRQESSSRSPVDRFELECADCLADALALLAGRSFDVILLDLSLPDGQGLETVARMRSAVPEAPLVVMSGLSDEAVAIRAVQAGAQDYLVKGHADGDLLVRAIRYAIERVQTLKALRESERFLHSTLDALSAHIAILDGTGRIVAVNAAWRRFAATHWLIGASCDAGSNYLDACSASGKEGLAEANALARGIRAVMTNRRDHFHLEYASEGPAGKRWFAVHSTRFAGPGPARVVVAHEDITERKYAEEQARQRQAELAHVARVSTMGEMATGLAHELNQPLAAIVSYAKGCIRRMRSGSAEEGDLLGALEQISRQAVRASEIIRRLRRFVRRGPPRRDRVGVNDLVREAVAFAEPESQQREIPVRLRLEQNLPAVEVDRIQVEQVILNLIRNGFEAIGGSETPERVVDIRTAADGAHRVHVAVSDSGRGLSADIAGRVFDQFFSTKRDGLGMGLSISKSIIEAHGGRLWATPNREWGTTFEFSLPAAEGGVVDDR